MAYYQDYFLSKIEIGTYSLLTIGFEMGDIQGTQRRVHRKLNVIK
jgi:hypothetical protein